jgi:DNA replication initiation complex subunit (GINS family)
MGGNNQLLEHKVIDYTKECVAQEVIQVMTAGGATAKIGTMGIVDGIGRAMANMTDEEKEFFKSLLAKTLQL